MRIYVCPLLTSWVNRYWGIFWIDGSSVDRLKETLVSNVAEKAGVSKDHEAALYWLSNEDESWLLAIDNADDPDVDLIRFLPQGANGNILITTRFQCSIISTVGSVAFYGMNNSDATQLFFKIAGTTTDAQGEATDRRILS